jgi:hypothetical protein
VPEVVERVLGQSSQEFNPDLRFRLRRFLTISVLPLDSHIFGLLGIMNAEQLLFIICHTEQKKADLQGVAPTIVLWLHG